MITVLLLGAALPMPASAEEFELRTYYPVPPGDRHISSLTVGDDYLDETPGDGEALVFDSVGIGTTAPAGPLHVVGAPDTVSSVVFMPGTDTGAFGVPELNMGIGTTIPRNDPPNGQTGNLDVNDIFIRSLGTWISQIPDSGGGTIETPLLQAGTYVGNYVFPSPTNQTIPLGFTPRIVLIGQLDNRYIAVKLGHMYTPASNAAHVIYYSSPSTIGLYSAAMSAVQIVTNGFIAAGTGANANARTYYYLAIG